MLSNGEAQPGGYGFQNDFGMPNTPAMPSRSFAKMTATRIRDLSTGLVEIRGVAKGPTVQSPVTKTPCLVYSVAIDDIEAGEGGDSSRKHAAGWFVLDEVLLEFLFLLLQLFT